MPEEDIIMTLRMASAAFMEYGPLSSKVTYIQEQFKDVQQLFIK